MVQELRDILFLDIETVSMTGNYEALPDRLKIQWERKAAFFRNDGAQTEEELYHQRAGIYAEFGKVVCIAVGKLVETPAGIMGLRVKAYSGHDEKSLLIDFAEMLSKLDADATRLCAHNGKEFDFPYLSRRFLVNGVPLPSIFNLSGRKPWEVPHLDTLEMWKFGDHKHYTSLDLLATIFDIPSSKGEMDGSKVSGVYHQEGNLEKIKEYCMGDVVVLARLYLKLKEAGNIAEASIEYVN